MTSYMEDFPGPRPSPLCGRAIDDLADHDARIVVVEAALAAAESDIDDAESTLASLAGSVCMFAEPDLAVGTTKTNVAHGAVTFMVDGKFYTLPANAAGVAFTAVTVPQNKYGAWAYDVGANLTVDVIAAADNATGYNSAALAAAALAAPDSGHKRLGIFTAASSDAGGFVAGTTEIDAVAVTEAFTDETPVATLSVQKTAFYNGVMTQAGLAVADGDAHDIDHGAFDYVVNGQKYSKTATGGSEIAPDALSATAGAAKYNGWIFTIGTDGTVDLAEDTNDSAGYDTAAAALVAAKALDPAASHIVIGWAAVGNESGVVTPGTTALTGNVTFEDAPTMFEVASGNATMP